MTRRRSASRTSRTRAVSRGRGTATVSGRSPTSRSTWSTAGSRRRRAARSALIERRLDLFAEARNDFLSLSAPGLDGPPSLTGLPSAAYRILGQPRPQLLEIPGGQALALERAGPLDRERFEEPVALGRQTARLAHEIGKPGRRAHSFT